MKLRKPRTPSRLRIVVLAAACGLLAIVSSAAAVVYVYNNGFNSRSAYREINRNDADKSCDKSWVKKSDSMRVAVKGRDFCGYAPPVLGDREQPDHEIQARGRILDSTSKNLRRHTYLSVLVRVGKDTFYEFKVNPKERQFRLTRKPNAAGLPISGDSNKINNLGEGNTLRLRVTGGEVRAFVNGASVANFTDPTPGQVTGRRVAFGVGTTKSTESTARGSFTSVKVGVPTP